MPKGNLKYVTDKKKAFLNAYTNIATTTPKKVTPKSIQRAKSFGALMQSLKTGTTTPVKRAKKKRK